MKIKAFLKTTTIYILGLIVLISAIPFNIFGTLIHWLSSWAEWVWETPFISEFMPTYKEILGDMIENKRKKEELNKKRKLVDGEFSIKNK